MRDVYRLVLLVIGFHNCCFVSAFTPPIYQITTVAFLTTMKLVPANLINTDPGPTLGRGQHDRGENFQARIYIKNGVQLD